MPRNICCVPGCQVVAEDGVPLHYFPCPEKDAERFHNWVKIIGGGIASLDNTTIHKTHRICRQHFQKEFLYPKNRLCKLAVPSLLLPSADVSAPSPPSTSQGAILHRDVIKSITTTTEYFKTSSSESGCLPEESVDTAHLIILFDNLFDSVNANYHKEEGKIYTYIHLNFWNKTLPILRSMKYINNNGKKVTVPSLTSWVKTVEDFKLITNKPSKLTA